MTASVNGATYEFGIKSYGATNASLPAKLEIRSGGWGGNGEADLLRENSLSAFKMTHVKRSRSFVCYLTTVINN